MLRFHKNRSGNIAMSVFVLLGMTSLLAIFTYLGRSRILGAAKKVQDTQFSVMNYSGIETMLLAYRMAEMQYIQQVSVCSGSANPFLKALKEGTNCAAVTTPIKVFDPATQNTTNDIGLAGNIYTYPAGGNGCKIGFDKTTTTCSTQFDVLHIGIEDTTQKISGATFDFFLTAVTPEKQIAEFTVKVDPGNGQKPTTNAFAIRTSLSNAAHLEADGRVTQENPDPLARCPGTPFANYKILNNGNCIQFVTLGSGTGLAFYNNRYFGFRPFDGQVIDMIAASNGSASYMVDEDGTVSGATPAVFVPYNNANLMNRDDITVISKQVYFVGGQAAAAQIGVLNPANLLGSPIKVCNLGGLGWEQSYEGLAALSWSDPVIPETGDGYPNTLTRFASFFLKTSSGDMLNAIVTRNLTACSAAETTASSCLTYSGAFYRCSVFKYNGLLSNDQNDYYKRTYGFDRTGIEKPYFVY